VAGTRSWIVARRLHSPAAFWRTALRARHFRPHGPLSASVSTPNLHVGPVHGGTFWLQRPRGEGAADPPRAVTLHPAVSAAGLYSRGMAKPSRSHVAEPPRPAFQGSARLEKLLLLVPFGAVLAVSVPTRRYDYFTFDVFGYLDRVNNVLAGLMPFRDFPSEYPPLSFVPMLLPRLVTGNAEGYLWLFALESAVLSSLIAAMVYWLAVRGWSVERPLIAETLYVLSLVVLASIAAWRFELFVVLLTMLSVVAFSEGRFGTAGVILGLGVVAKIYPVLLLPVLALRLFAAGDRRGVARLVAGCIATVGLVMIPLLLVAGSGAWGPVTWQDARGLQIESVGSGLLLLAHVLFGVTATPENAFQAEQIASPVAGLVLQALPLITLTLLGVIIAACFLRFRQDWREMGRVSNERVIAYVVLVLLALIVSNKVLSPQYLLWLMPFMALLRRRQALLFVATCVATIAIFPLGYKMLLNLQPAMIMVLNIRNGLLILLLAWLLIEHSPRMSSRQLGRNT
jgi:hypothetical protein